MDFWRQRDIVGPKSFSDMAVTIIGAGTIGSWTALSLAKLGVERLEIFDGDTVERHNLPPQLYGPEHIDKPKVIALREIIENLTGIKVKARQENFLYQELRNGIVISAVDSMAARKQIWMQAVEYNPKIQLYIDGRMGALAGRIFVLNPCSPSQIRKYLKSLYSDGESHQEACSRRAICYNAFLIAGVIAGEVARFARGELNWQTDFDADSLTFSRHL